VVRHTELIAVTSAESSAGGEDSTSGTVSTAITLSNANAMSAAGEAFIASTKRMRVQLDMAKVEPSSVAVAVTLAWLASAQRHGKQLGLENLGADFSGVIEFSGLSSMFSEHIS
jgi:hypothetical protein